MVCNSLDLPLVSAHKQCRQAHSVIEAEACAVRFGLQIALELGFYHLQVETGCLSLAQKFNGYTEDLSDLGMIIEDIRTLLSNLSLLFAFYPHFAKNSPHDACGPDGGSTHRAKRYPCIRFLSPKSMNESNFTIIKKEREYVYRGIICRLIRIIAENKRYNTMKYEKTTHKI